MFNVIIAGNLGRDPETRFTPSGQKVTSFTVAVNQRKGKEDVTIWVRVTVWGDRFDKMISYLKKGGAVIATGRMNPPTSYTDKEGRTQVSLEMTAEMLEFSPFGKERSENQGNQANPQSNHNATPAYQNYNSQNEETQYPYGRTQSSFASQSVGQGNHGSESIDEDALPF